MAQINSNIIADYRKSIITYIKSLAEEEMFGGINFSSLHINENGVKETYNLETIKKTFIKKFTDDLKIQNMDIWTAKRIAKEQAKAILESVLVEVN